MNSNFLSKVPEIPARYGSFLMTFWQMVHARTKLFQMNKDFKALGEKNGQGSIR